jgi:hypothetical protein
VNHSDSFVGAVADGSNGSGDDLGQATEASDMDRMFFDNRWRTWGVAGSWPDSSLRDECDGEKCQIRDWRLVDTDTWALGRLPRPIGGDAVTLTHFWEASSEADCEALGATWADPDCSTQVLQNAWEIQGDGHGNDNLLCEAGEHCLYTPNFGAYQGEGALVRYPTPGGPKDDVVLWHFADNGVE